MGYYRPQGDYYAGYRGDPGIGSFFRGLVSKAAGFIPGVGPIVGPAVSGVLGKFGQVVHMPGGAVAGGITAAAKGVGAQIVKHPVLTAAGAAGALGGTMGAVAEHVLGGGACGRGRSTRRPLKKCGTILKSGKCGKCYRSMNVCNPHALRRAIRRTRGFAKLAMRSIHIIHPKKKGRFGGFKTRRRK